MHMNAWWKLGLAAILVAGVVVVGQLETGAMGALRIGMPAPEITGDRWINSQPLSLASLRGQVVVVEFWTFG